MTYRPKDVELGSNEDVLSIPLPTKESQERYNATIQRMTSHMSKDERQIAVRAAAYGYGPLAHLHFPNGNVNLPFGGEMQPGLFKSIADRNFANPAPLGLCSFALTTFLLSLINLGTLNVTDTSIMISVCFGYGGLMQILAGMWEMAVGNTFGATVFFVLRCILGFFRHPFDSWWLSYRREHGKSRWRSGITQCTSAVFCWLVCFHIYDALFNP